jgi:Ras GTPase-activating-like protein IQGAP2/3
LLQRWSENFFTAIVNTTNKVPYGIRYLARETLAALREKFPHVAEEEYASCLGRLIYYRSINPAIM